jgi:biopolymer transport protein ExbD
MRLARPAPPPRLISLVSMIDVLLIMLVFFMVTSTYLDLDMIPMAGGAEDATTGATTGTDADPGAPLVLRLGADGGVFLRGRPVTPDDLATLVAARPDAPVTILPSLRAETQALVTLMDLLTGAGAGTVRLLRVAEP